MDHNTNGGTVATPMTTARRFIAEVPPAYRAQEIRWLVLEQDTQDSGGWFTYGHRELDEPSEFDDWHQTRHEAEQDAATQWGIPPTSWHAYLMPIKD